MSGIPARSPVHGDGAEASFAVQFHLLGSVDYEDCQWLQRRLVYEVGGHDDGRIIVLLCEHPPLISVGRRGSRGHIRWTNEQLRRRRLDVRWVNRGGGCVLHAPGQLAIYPIVPLAWHGWTVGEYLRRLQQAVLQTLDEFRIRAETYAPWAGVWGRSGQLAACGVAVRDWITCHGAFLNVNPGDDELPLRGRRGSADDRGRSEIHHGQSVCRTPASDLHGQGACRLDSQPGCLVRHRSAII